jgi:perosamine synthetase
VCKETGNISLESIKKKTSPKTKCIVVVHWAGQPVEIKQIYEFASKKGIKVVSDAAHAMGAYHYDSKIGDCKYSDFTCFSFQAIKHLTTADGGAICCKNTKDADRVRKIRWFGLDRKFSERTGRSRWDQDIVESGFKMHMNNLNAAIGIAQMDHIEDIIGKHIENGKYYDENITNPKIKKMKQCKHSKSSYWIYSILVDDKKDFMLYAKECGIGCDVVHVRNDKYTVFRHFKAEDTINLDYFSSRLVNIPVGWWVSKKDREYIVDCLNNY